MKKRSKLTVAQQVEQAELALQQQDIDRARECLQDAACLAPEVITVLDGLEISEAASQTPTWAHGRLALPEVGLPCEAAKGSRADGA